MTVQEIRQKAKQFKKTFGVRDCSHNSLQKATEAQGYTVVEFNHIFNDAAVQSLIDVLKLSENILKSKGFTYADENYRLVFIHEDLSEEERKMVLAHENGHIFLGHMKSVPVIGKDVTEEFEANEFSHYLLNKSAADVFGDFLIKHKKMLLSILAIIILIISGITAYGLLNREEKNHSEYYVTATGKKYHEKECVFVKGKDNVRLLTEEEYENGDYEPCKTCLP